MKKFCLLLLRGYQYLISPWVGHNCRFVPTCSQYSMDAINRFGVIRGCWLTCFRLLKCHPFGGSGLDEVPQRFRWNCWCHNSDCTFSTIIKNNYERTNHGK